MALGWSFSLSLLCLCWMVSKACYGREEVPCGDLRFLPSVKSLEGRTPVVCTWQQNAHLRPCYRGRRLGRRQRYCYWLLMLAGDVERNPGPPDLAVMGEVGQSGNQDGRCAPIGMGCGYLKCQVLNARSIVNKSRDLQALLVSEKLDAVAITETFLSHDILDSELLDGIPDFTIFRRDRNRQGGGVMLVLRNGIPAIRRTDLETDCELLWVEITPASASSNFLLGVFYRPPGTISSSVLNELHRSMSAIPDSQLVILCGDFNLPGRQIESLSDLALDRSLTQMVKHPTRGENILDLLLTNSPETVSQVDVVDGIPGSDHEAIQFLARVIKPAVVRQNRFVYNFKRGDFDRFRDLLSEIPWNCCFLSDNVDDSWNRFKDLLLTAADQSIPKVRLSRRKRVHWLSAETLQLIRKKRRQYKQAKRSGKQEDLARYKKTSNTVRRLTRKDHCDHLEAISQQLVTNQRVFWRWLKNVRGGFIGIPNLKFMGKVFTAAADKAKVFNSYFCSIFTKENLSNLTSRRNLLQASWSTASISDVIIDEDSVSEVLGRIDPSKACGPDEIPGRLLKEGAPWLVEPLTKLFNMSLQSGCLPTDWRRANVTPMFKKGNKHSPANYRPISLTSLVVKCLERLVHARIMEFLDVNNKLNRYQHGFRSGHSCQTQLLATTHEWARSLDKRASTHVIYLDFSKAFDSVPHRRLLMKLDCMGVRGNLLRWINAFLSDREQRVLVDGQSSDWMRVTSGVPQGSILGPLFFLVFVNDIDVGLKSSIRLFADDCAIFRVITCKQDCDGLQADLNRLYHWTQLWQLSLNQSKCKAMRITNKRTKIEYTYNLNNVLLEWVDTFKYLGVKFNSKLTWTDQVSEAKLKATRVLNLLRRSMHGCSEQAKARAYTALVRPHLETCSPVWAPYQKGAQDELEKVQKRAARWICARWDKTNHRWSRSYDECRSRLRWATVRQRHVLLSCCQAFKIVHNLDCLVFHEYLCFNESRMRSHRLSLRCVGSRVRSFRYSFFINIPFLWNTLPIDILNTTSYSAFKFKFKKTIF